MYIIKPLFLGGERYREYDSWSYNPEATSSLSSLAQFIHSEFVLMKAPYPSIMAIANGASMPIFATVRPKRLIASYQTLISGLSSEVTASRPPSYHVALVAAA